MKLMQQNHLIYTGPQPPWLAFTSHWGESYYSATDKQKRYVAQSYCCCTKATSTLVDSNVKINTLLWHTFIKNNMFIDLN